MSHIGYLRYGVAKFVSLVIMLQVHWHFSFISPHDISFYGYMAILWPDALTVLQIAQL